MGQALEVISGSVTGAGATITASTPASGDSFAMRNTDLSKKIWLMDAWGYNDTAAGLLRIRSPRLHDNVQGIRMRVVNNLTSPLLSGAADFIYTQRLYPQDVLTVEQTGSAANIDTAHLLILYDDVPGISGRFIDNATLMAAGINRVGQEVSVTTTAASANYTGAVAINVTNDNFKPNTDYAILGVETDVRVGTIGIKGADTGNVRVGIPGEPSVRHVFANWFQRLSKAYSRALIPVFNSAAKGSILVDCTGHTAAITAVLTIHLVELLPGKAPQAVLPAQSS
jgi:hypothetical protein